jgi:hypothetical protein
MMINLTVHAVLNIRSLLEQALDMTVELAPLLSNHPQRPMYTNTHLHTPVDRKRPRRHPLPSERASHSRINSAHLHSTLQQNRPPYQLGDHLLAHLAPPPLLKSLAPSLFKFIHLLTTGVSAACIHDTFN